MARESYRRRLAELRERVVEMADLVVRRLRLALETLEAGDGRLAREVVEGDREINELYLELESECIDLFAHQQPVAGDLGFVAASFNIITELERIGDLERVGDHAVNVAARTLYAEESDDALLY